jgi:hypothetical protein
MLKTKIYHLPGPGVMALLWSPGTSIPASSFMFHTRVSQVHAGFCHRVLHFFWQNIGIAIAATSHKYCLFGFGSCVCFATFGSFGSGGG